MDRLAPTQRDALTTWLHDHGIDPARLAVGQPIERDTTVESLTWREATVDGVRRVTRLPAVAKGERWPAPFPAELHKPQPVA